jgi:citrate lyase beta subunit
VLNDSVYADLDRRLADSDADLARRYPGEPPGRQPVHTVYVPADRFHAGTAPEWGRHALAALDGFPPLPFDDSLLEPVRAKLAREPIEDLRIDFEDGYGVPDDDTEDRAAVAAATAVRQAVAAGCAPPFLGLRIKCLERYRRQRAIRTLDLFLTELGPPPPGFVVTLPKVSTVAQVEAMVVLCGALEAAYGIDRLRFEVQVETPPAILGPDGTATVARLIHAGDGRISGLHYGTYDYSNSVGIAAGYQSLEHPAADHAKAVMQAAAAGTGVRLSDGSTNVLPVGSPEAVHAAWALHLRLVRRSLERGFYQGWDLHPAQLPTRYAATYAFFRAGEAAARERLAAYHARRESGILDEPATVAAIETFLRRGRDCGALSGA